jgi:hypothetical protein
MCYITVLLQNGYMTFPWNVISMYFLSFEELTEFSISNRLDWVECRSPGSTHDSEAVTLAWSTHESLVWTDPRVWKR